MKLVLEIGAGVILGNAVSDIILIILRRVVVNRDKKIVQELVARAQAIQVKKGKKPEGPPGQYL